MENLLKELNEKLDALKEEKYRLSTYVDQGWENGEQYISDVDKKIKDVEEKLQIVESCEKEFYEFFDKIIDSYKSRGMTDYELMAKDIKNQFQKNFRKN